MLLPVAALLSLAAADPVVVALPLSVGDGVSKAEAAGVDVVWRERVEEAGFLKLLARTDQDADEAFRCGRDPGCLGRVATERGADLIVAGSVDEAPDGFTVHVIVVEPGAERALRTADEPVQGTRQNMADWLDRLVRIAFRPAALAGGVMVRGNPRGARVYLDDKEAGTVPFDEPLPGIVEGTHRLRIEADGYAPYNKRIDVRFREVTEVDVTLRAMGTVASEGPEISILWDVVPWVVVGAGGAALAGGGVFGALSLLDATELERRAARGSLVFPRDADLLARGEFYSWTANGLYATGTLLVVGGAALWVAGLALRTEDERTEVVAAPVEGAPDWEELQPGVGN